VLLMLPQQPEQGAGDGTERDLGVANREAPRGLAGLDIAQGARRQAVGRVEQVESLPVRKRATSGCGSSRAARRSGTRRRTPQPDR
jgi:hypothetical protein